MRLHLAVTLGESPFKAKMMKRRNKTSFPRFFGPFGGEPKDSLLSDQS